MNTSRLTNSSEFELELSFTGAPQSLLEQLSDQSARTVLTEAQFWQKNLIDWIQFFRCNLSLSCPELVRLSSSVSMGLQFTDDLTIKSLNSYWRQRNEKTDVLSFPMIDDEIIFPQGQSLEIGDIVVSVITAECQAKEQNHSLASELLWLVSHGFMHLLGWDHPTSDRLQEMLHYQEQLLCINGNL